MPQRNRRCAVAPAPVDAASGATPAPVRASTAPQDIAAAGAKPRRPRWQDICERFWNVLGCGLGRKRRSSVVVVESLRQNGSRDNVSSSQNGSGDNVINDMGHGGDVLKPPVDPPRKENCAWLQRPKEPNRLKVNGCTVSDEELAIYAMYCQDSLKYRQKIICHMCVFDEKYRYCENKFSPTEMLKHCWDVHKKVGLECKHSECRVRVSTEKELIFHYEFCHRLDSGWWNNDEYRRRLEKY
ncbi:hypothetical protein QOZ80_5BG0422550 [Eleusine coracana subsp. coracana]|nr:hypothetical protein QOZ80_5BG0422550 [Eleusine coracana subsp. coracana]